MPSKKPKIMTYTSEKIVKKFNFVSEHEKRSASKQLEYLIEQCISEYEAEHGELIIEEDGTVHPKQIATKDKSGKSSTFKVG